MPVGEAQTAVAGLRSASALRQPDTLPGKLPASFDAELPRESLDILWTRLQKRTLYYARGRTIYWQGDRSDAVFLNVKGTVLLKVFSKTGKEGVLEVVANGEIFGEACVFEEDFRSSAAVALEPTTVISCDKQSMQAAIRNSPESAEVLLRHMIKRNQKLRSHLTDQLFSSSKLRLLRVLRVLSRGREEREGWTQLPRISQSMLSSMVGTTRSRVCYFLVQFRNEGLVKMNDGLWANTARMDAMLAK